MKVLLVDDEHLQREGLRKAIDWKQFDMEVVATAENGEEAFSLFKELHPHIIITDICMPFMDGLQLTSAVKNLAPETEIVILTCYDEFDYAKRAVRLGACDYVVKPVELEYMHALLKTIAIRHQEEHQELEKAVLSMQRETALALVYRRGDPMQLKAQSQACGLSDFVPSCCMMVKILGYRYAKATFPVAELDCYFQGFYNLVLRCLRGMHLIIEPKLEEGRVLLVVGAQSDHTLDELIQQIQQALLREAELTNEYPFLCAIGNNVPQIEQIRESYCQCVALLKQEFLIERTTFVHYTPQDSRRMHNRLDLTVDIHKFMENVRTFDPKVIQSSLSSITERIREESEYIELYGQLFVSTVYSETIRLLQDMSIESTDVFSDPMDEYLKIAVRGNLNQYMKGIEQFLVTICDYVARNQVSAQGAVIEKARRYIDANYTSSSLSLQTVADQVQMSPSYFSILFKQMIEKSFITYLTELRMERAKYLLRKTGYKSYEICLMVGYDNPTYFSTLFKRTTGLSPTEYRSNIS